MKHIFLIIIVSVMIFSVTTAGAKKKFGKEISIKEATKISTIIANPEKFNGKKILVEGPIVDVCKMRGCWINIAGDEEFQTLRFKVDDGVMVFPMEVKGKNVVAEGILSVKTYSIEELIENGKEQAKESGKEFDALTVKKPKTVIMLKGEGAQVEVE